MKKFLNVIAITLALNFLAAAGGVGWLVQSKHLDKDKFAAIREIVFPSSQPTTQISVASNASTQPVLRLEELLAHSAGRSASEQVDYIQHAFDQQMAQLDQRRRELLDLQHQVDLARDALTRDREKLSLGQKELSKAQQLQSKNETDKGFQDALTLYTSLPPKQVKDIFMGMKDDVVVQFLQAMEPRVATKILKEFKGPDQARAATLLERLRQPSSPTAAASQ
jgi:flagellar motility protein MotE (MotC chaperone)